MRRVVITGMGITSCLGNDLDTVSSALRELRPGIRTLPDHAEAGLRSQVGGAVEIDLDAQIDRKLKRFMSDAAAYSYIAMRDAIADAGLEPDQVSNVRTGLIAGSGGGSSQWQVEAADLLRNVACARSARTWCRARCAPPCRPTWPPRSRSRA
jgi:3-oxoacyl-(acyl-carrier-protein) synthase